jgi:hypothetical protein
MVIRKVLLNCRESNRNSRLRTRRSAKHHRDSVKLAPCSQLLQPRLNSSRRLCVLAPTWPLPGRLLGAHSFLNSIALRPELPAAATMLVAEHGGVAHSPAGWWIAVVVLRYFVAVLMLSAWVRTTGVVHRRHRVFGSSEGLALSPSWGTHEG